MATRLRQRLTEEEDASALKLGPGAFLCSRLSSLAAGKVQMLMRRSVLQSSTTQVACSFLKSNTCWRTGRRMRLILCMWLPDSFSCVPSSSMRMRPQCLQQDIGICENVCQIQHHRFSQRSPRVRQGLLASVDEKLIVVHGQDPSERACFNAV